ncbi:hypothetical protein HOY82DRAFT_551934 [Tuber indicum]|nr:hypothetical protein HOY82DRAFT_551934 [Tuber indicum]
MPRKGSLPVWYFACTLHSIISSLSFLLKSPSIPVIPNHARLVEGTLLYLAVPYRYWTNGMADKSTSQYCKRKRKRKKPQRCVDTCEMDTEFTAMYHTLYCSSPLTPLPGVPAAHCVGRELWHVRY